MEAVLAERYANSLRLSELLNRLSLNSPNGGARYRMAVEGRRLVETPNAVLEAMTMPGHDLEVRDSRYFANFGDLIHHGHDVLTPFWIDTGLPVPGTVRTLLVPVSHSRHEFIVRGPVVNADLSFYFGIDGEAVFRPSVTRDQAWVMGRVAHRYRGAEALEVTRLAGNIVRAWGAVRSRHHPAGGTALPTRAEAGKLPEHTANSLPHHAPCGRLTSGRGRAWYPDWFCPSASSGRFRLPGSACCRSTGLR
ncbi:hypothetical protein JL100_022135 [Skermanella mucosa]|uniref:hypothetical protein n=1 Tax=Skermanella mucosa TaxID=1789672 RepID=UPI001E39052A|nr:hypothetical protein [Skermanella mucosa]UEM19760.1 hypothetical protein JL100_022135 [Skermanella mucosa]